MCMAQAMIQVTLLQPVTSFFRNLPILLTCFFSSCSCKITAAQSPSLTLLFPFQFPSPLSCYQVVPPCCLGSSLLDLLSPCPMPQSCHQFFSGFVTLSCYYNSEYNNQYFYSSLGNCSAKFCIVTPFLPPFPLLPSSSTVLASAWRWSIGARFSVEERKASQYSEFICPLVSLLVSIRLRLFMLKQGGRQESLAEVKKEKHVTNQ